MFAGDRAIDDDFALAGRGLTRDDLPWAAGGFVDQHHDWRSVAALLIYGRYAVERMRLLNAFDRLHLQTDRLGQNGAGRDEIRNSTLGDDKITPTVKTAFRGLS